MSAAIVQQQGSSSGASSVTTKTQTIGSATTAGNLLVGHLCKPSTQALSTEPSGWNGVAVENLTTNTYHQSYKENCSASEADPTWTWATSQRCVSHIFEISGCATSSALDVTATKSNASGTSGDTGTTAATSANGIAIGGLAFGATTANTPSSDGDHTYSVVGTTNIEVFLADKLITSGATANIAFTWTGSSSGRGGICVYKEAGGGGAPTVKTLATLGVG